MTIYTPSQGEKKPDKDVSEPEVVTEPLTSFKDEEEAALDNQVQVNYFQRKRRTYCIHLLLIIFILVVLACGAIGATVFYKHLNKRVYSGVCGNIYIDTQYNRSLDRFIGDALEDQPMDYVEERIQVSEVDLYEELYTPRFDEVRENLVWHDFARNFSVIIDREVRMCYVMKLNRSIIAPPRDLIDLVDKLMSGYYLPKARVIRENYHMVQPRLSDLSTLGPRIASKCGEYATYWLEKFVGGVVKRSVKEIIDDKKTYAVLSNHIDHQEIYKIIVHDYREVEVASAE
ncbi:integral membrane protein 2B-like isoform X2 [Physella acuta]|uniref:integral membrane protein 2B-like isoform X2 n=1 Tax=Physella acuta TaxID=109671 RepID=UPI0027DE3184|nr:integral membrane protein 2B-like isoform X2 [Physella acuta]